jgi:hypothetical protein
MLLSVTNVTRNTWSIICQLTLLMAVVEIKVNKSSSSIRKNNTMYNIKESPVFSYI